MRLNTFLLENLSVDEKIDILKKECNPFLSSIKNKNYKLYRGMWPDDAPKTFTSIPVIQNRVPRNTPKILHDLYNKAFYSIFGKKLRSSSIFCTGNANQAEIYGDTYLILPIGKFDCYWSPIINDLFLFDYIQELLNLNKNANKDIITFLIYTCLTRIKLINYNIQNNKALQNKFNELIHKSIKTDVDIDNTLAQYTPHIIQNATNTFIKEYYKKDNIQKAIDSGNEIMVSCQSYYALDLASNQQIWNSLF